MEGFVVLSPPPHPTWEFHFTVASYFPLKTLAFLPLDLIPHGLTWLSSGASNDTNIYKPFCLSPLLYSGTTNTDKETTQPGTV